MLGDVCSLSKFFPSSSKVVFTFRDVCFICPDELWRRLEEAKETTERMLEHSLCTPVGVFPVGVVSGGTVETLRPGRRAGLPDGLSRQCGQQGRAYFDA